MLELLPISCWLILWLSFSSRTQCWRKAFLQASTVWSTYAVVIVELLSFATSLTRVNLVVAWTLALIACAYFAYKSSVKIVMPRIGYPVTLTLMALMTSLLGVVAWWCAPNNYDSLTYHLTRIEHWVVNKSVAHYPIHVLRQLTLNPGAEYLILNSRLLSNSDMFDNLLQWFSMIGCLTGTSLIAKQIGADVRGQILTSVICLTIPIGMLECTSTQNDYVAAFWLVSLISFSLSWANQRTENGGSDLAQATWVGLALGIGAVTKATIYFFAFAPMILLAVALFKRIKFRAVLPLALTGFLSLALSLPFMIRNVQTFGAPLVNRCIYEPGYRASNDSYAPQFVVSNVLRTLAAELQAPIPIWNNIVFSGVERIHQLFHWNPSDPRNTFDEITFGTVHPGFMFQEDIAGNPIHTLLFIVAFGLLLAAKQFPQKRMLLIYGSGVVIGFAIFNTALKWQPWHSRLLLPLYVVGAAFVGCVLSKQSARMHSALVGFLLLYATPYLIANPNKLLIGNESIFVTSRDENYFRSVPNYYAPYLKARDFLEEHHAANVGVAADDTSWAEYPLWILLNQNFQKTIKIEGLSVPEWKSYHGAHPDAMISNDRKPPDVINLPDQSYRRTLICDSTSDRFMYHFFGKEIGKTYNHLSMALYLPEKVDANKNEVLTR